MADFATMRRMMVDGQVRTADVTDPRIIDAMLALPRERFLPAHTAALAYLDLDVPVGEPVNGVAPRRLLKPMVLAKMIQALQIESGERVLDVGCATGYAAAVLAALSGSVVALEEDAGLVRAARETLAESGGGQIEVVQGTLSDGYEAGGPYDAILVEGAVEVPPANLCRQLRNGGRLICIQGAVPPGKATLYRCDAGEISERPVFHASAQVLPGFARPPAFVF